MIGEYELIKFLSVYLDDRSNNRCNQIIIMDEPCTKLSSQNKRNLHKELFSDNGKQLIVVTHDIELIDIEVCKNLLYFSLVDNKTKCFYIDKINGEKTKLLFEHPEILFANKIILVEGYDDYIFVKHFIKVHKIYDYQIVIMGGCGNKIWQIMDELDIKYKIIYDIDKLTGTNDIKKIKINYDCLNFIIKRVNRNSDLWKNINIKLQESNITNINIAETIICGKHNKFHIEILTILLSDYYKNDNFQKCVINIDSYNTDYKSNQKNDLVNRLRNHELNMSLGDFMNKYVELYNDQIKPHIYDKKIIEFVKEYPAEVFLDRLKMKIQIDYVYMFDTDDINILINTIMKEDNRYFIFDKNTIDIEGIAKKVYGVDNFNKSRWTKLDFKQLEDNIKKYELSDPLNNLYYFLIK